MPTLTKAEIINAIYEKSQRNRPEIKIHVDTLIAIIKEGIKKDGALLISGFGKFDSYAKNPRRGRNPQTNEAVTLPGRKVVVFRISRKLRAELNPQ